MQKKKVHCGLWFRQGFLSILAVILVSICLVPNSAYSLPAFPGAEGFGSNTVGGRGGKVYQVTNLNDSGAGSLRECINASGPRVCVFRVGGTINLSSGLVISNPYITIAGQTAPGGGITLKNVAGCQPISVRTHDVVMRYITVRFNPLNAEGVMGVTEQNGDHYNVVVDHCSMSWGVDDIYASWYNARNITVQWSLFSEALNCSVHSKGCHSKGVMLSSYASSEQKNAAGAYNLTLHHSLMAHIGERTPMVKASGLCDVVNNVQYNNFNKHAHVYLTSKFGTWPVNFVNNYFKKGPNTSTSKEALGVVNEGGSPASIYWNGNISHNRPTNDLSQTKDVSSEALPYITTTHHNVSMPVTTTSALTAYDQVLADAGNNKGINANGTWFYRRDAHDTRVVNDVKNKTGKIIDHPSQVGGWLSIANGTPYPDADKDGMSDDWEKLNGLDPANAADGILDSDGDGYTNLEEFLNGTNPRGSGTQISTTSSSSSATSSSAVAPTAPSGLKAVAN